MKIPHSLTAIVAALALEGCTTLAKMQDAPPHAITKQYGDTLKVYYASYGGQLIGVTLKYPVHIVIEGKDVIFDTERSFMYGDRINGFSLTTSANTITREEMKQEEKNYKKLLHENGNHTAK